MNIMIDEKSGGMAFWSGITDVARDMVHSAAAAIGIEKYVPEAPPASTALYESMEKYIAERFGKVKHQPLRVLRTQQPRTFEAVRCLRGDDKNEHRFLFSASVEDDGCIKVLAANNGGWVADNGCTVSDISLHNDVQELVRKQLTILPGPYVTGILCKGLKRWGCQALNDRGGLWFLPTEVVPLYRTWAEHLYPTGCRFTHCEVTVSHNPEFVEHLLDNLREEVVQGLNDITNDMMSADGGMQDRSIRIRLAKAEAFLAKITKYEGITGVTLDDLRTVADRTKQALGVQKLLASSL
jgi:hypothetical protein